uniref:Cell division protein FtsA n=1 Tax=Acidobacterium capsulatum TaxID=33075 RepID=A0A7V4XQW7_9BACT
MSQKNSNLITVLDAGSSKVRVMVAELHEEALRFRAFAEAPSAGQRRGIIADLAKATAAINQAATQAEVSAQAVIESLVIGIGGPHLRGVNSRSGITMGTRLREITREDVRAAVERARSVSLPADREILHLLPQQFILDEQPGIADPIGMVGNRLEVNLHLVAASASAVQSLVTCANRASLEVTDTVFEAIAAAESTLSADERELGVCLLDIGAGSTEIIVFFEGAVQHTGVIPIGGDHFTNDLAAGLHVTPPEAEWLKCQYGHAVVTSVPAINEIQLTGMPGHEPRMVRQRYLSEILEPRARELFQMVRDNLRQGGVLEALGAGCVLTGGASRLGGMLDTTESLLRVPARIATPVPISRMPAELVVPEHAALVGLLLYTHRTRMVRAAEDQGLRAKLRAIFAGSV